MKTLTLEQLAFIGGGMDEEAVEAVVAPETVDVAVEEEAAVAVEVVAEEAAAE